MISVLLVDDEPVLLDIGRMFLERTGDFRVGEAESGQVALQRMNSDSYDAVVADYEMPEMDGLALLRKVRESWPDIPYILFTGRGREEVVIEALNSGADFYLQKGGDPKAQFTELAHKIRQAVLTRKASSDLKESEETFRQFFDAAGDAIFILDRDRITDCNMKALDILGRSREDVIGKDPNSFSTPYQRNGTDSAQYLQKIISHAVSGDTHPYEWRILRSDNTWTDTEVSMCSITIHGKKLIHAIVRDISIRRKHEEAARINEVRLKAMLDLYAIRDKTLKEITDYTLEQALCITGSRHGYLAFVSEDESVLTMYSWSGGQSGEIRQEKPISYEMSRIGVWGDAIRNRIPIILNDIEPGSDIEKELPTSYHPISRHMNVPIFDNDRIVLLAGVVNKDEPYSEDEVHQLTLLMSGMWGIVRRKKTEDILYKKNAELLEAYDQLRLIENELRGKYEDIRIRSADLAESEERFRRLSDQAPVYIMMGDETGHITYCNNQWRKIFSDSPVSADTLWMQALHPDDKSRIIDTYKKTYSVSDSFTAEYRIVTAQGNVIWLLSTATPRITSDGRMLGYIDVSVDITDRKMIELALVESEERYRSLVERSEDLIILLDENLHPVYASPSLKRITGISPDNFLNRPFDSSALNPEDREKILRLIDDARSEKPVQPLEISFVKSDGSQGFLDLRGIPVKHQDSFAGMQIIARDITHSRKMEEDLVRVNNRLTLLTDITRHDIMNNLTTLRGFLDIVNDEDGSGIGVCETVDLAQDAIQRIRYLLEFTRDYQSLGLSNAEWIDAKDAMNSAISQLSAGKVMILNDIQDISVLSDPLLSRAFFNLLENSLQHGRTVTRIRAYARIVGQSLSLVIEDDGVGVKESEKSRIFEKGIGENTGLGLFLVKEILTSSGFSIIENGKEGFGARFEITVPQGLFISNGS